MGLSEEIRQKLINAFKSEQREYTASITQGLLALEKETTAKGRQSLLEEIFRQAHSLKGSARAVGMTTIESLGHGLEGVLLNAKEGKLYFTPELFDLLYETIDAVELVAKQIERGETTPPVKVLELLSRLDQALTAVDEDNAPSEDSLTTMAHPETNLEPVEAVGPALDLAGIAAANDETIRVPTSKLDSLMAQFSELLTAKARVEQRLAEVQQMQHFVEGWNREWLAMRSGYNRLIRNGENGYSKDVNALIEFTIRHQEHLNNFTTRFNILSGQLVNDRMHFQFVIDELEREIKEVRMLPLSTITVTFGRMVRDMARQQGRQINLTIIGGETELDKRVLEQAKDPLIHLLRNAVAHGIEDVTQRRQAGKPDEGQITLRAGQQGNSIVIEVEDDGAGLDLAAIRQAAIRKGLVEAGRAAHLNHDEVIALIFHSGLSTSEIITDIAGRGVGLDVVRQNVEELQGKLRVYSEPGQRTTFTMTLPLTLTSSRGLLVQVGGQTFALPPATVERMFRIKQDDIFRLEGVEAISYEGKTVALAWLADLLEMPRGQVNDGFLIVVMIAVAEKRLGFIVDGLEGEQEIVIKSLGKQLVKVGGIAGAAILGSGEALLVLHPADLVKLAVQRPFRESPDNGGELSPKEVERKTILVVDDSVMTRTLEKNILETAGYHVNLAANGEEALGSLISGTLPDLIVSDINMPRLNGFELTDRIKKDGRYQNIPIILITSLDSPADKARGIEVGADAYIVKNKFDQGNLLEIIEQLI